MIAIIRIVGEINLSAAVKETLKRLNLNKKYSCIIIKEDKVELGMLKKVKNYVAYGEIKKDLFVKLIERRGKLIDKTKKLNPEKIVEEIEKGKKYKDLNLLPVFKLHPPRKGIDSKKHFGVGKGV